MTNDMIQLLVNTDQNLLLYLNGFHNAFGDYFMSTFTGKWIWVPMYASILYVLLKNFNWKITLCCLTAIALTILFADQVCASLIRPAVERLRPSNPANPISDLVHIVNNYRGGRYGFPSCHASNSFGLAFFLVFLFGKVYDYTAKGQTLAFVHGDGPCQADGILCESTQFFFLNLLFLFVVLVTDVAP